MALGRDHQDEVATAARPPLDLLEQMRRRLGAVGDDEQPDLRFSHAHMQRRAGVAPHHPDGVSRAPGARTLPAGAHRGDPATRLAVARLRCPRRSSSVG